MKKHWFYFFILFYFIMIDHSKVSAAPSVKNIPIAINDQFMNFPDEVSFVKDSTTFVPVRFLSEALGANFKNDKPGEITLTLSGKKITIFTTKNEIIFGNDPPVNVPIIVKNGRTFAPVRSIGQYYGFQVHYLSGGSGSVVRLINTTAILDSQTFLRHNDKIITDFYQIGNIDKRKKVFLTFDDGPTAGINEILNILKAKNAKASFFMIEPQMKKYPEEVRRLIREGHYPALHSVSHNKTLLYSGKPNAVANEMIVSQNTLMDIAGIRSHLVRVPFGSKPYMVKNFRDELVRHQFKMWDWDIDSEDWRYTRTNPKQISINVKEGFTKIKDKKESIVILFHINEGTIAVLPDIIDYIHSQGFQCVPYNPNEHFVVNFWHDNRL